MILKYNGKILRYTKVLQHMVGEEYIKRGNFLRKSFGGVNNFFLI